MRTTERPLPRPTGSRRIRTTTRSGSWRRTRRPLPRPTLGAEGPGLQQDQVDGGGPGGRPLPRPTLGAEGPGKQQDQVDGGGQRGPCQGIK